MYWEENETGFGHEFPEFLGWLKNNRLNDGVALVFVMFKSMGGSCSKPCFMNGMMMYLYYRPGDPMASINGSTR